MLITITNLLDEPLVLPGSIPPIPSGEHITIPVTPEGYFALPAAVQRAARGTVERAQFQVTVELEPGDHIVDFVEGSGETRFEVGGQDGQNGQSINTASGLYVDEILVDGAGFPISSVTGNVLTRG